MALHHVYVVYEHDDVGFGGICAWQAQFASVSAVRVRVHHTVCIHSLAWKKCPLKCTLNETTIPRLFSPEFFLTL